MEQFFEKIKGKIISAIPDAKVDLKSADGVHLEATVKSALFKGLTLVKQHKLVMQALSEEFSDALHALALKTIVEE